VFSDDFKLTMEGLAVGDTHRGECPKCGRKDTFTMTRKDQGAVVWNCYSTRCGFSGNAGGVRMNVVRTTPRQQKVTPFTGELRELSEQEKAFLNDKIGFGGRHLAASGVRYAPGEDRFAFPIFAPTGARRGWVLRAYGCDDLRRKALTRLDREEPHLSWYPGARFSNNVLVVEDIPSAVRAAVHYPGWVVAMCGGGIGPDYVRELTAYAKNIVWAFDQDATASALRHHRTYGLCFESSSVLPLEADLKDLDEPTLKEVLSHVS
jgi:ribosomal protein L37AE/L43A